MKLLFVNPHPDDTEFNAASTCQQAVDLGWEVHEILMTTDEYGTERNDFKGKRIRRIRKNEMIESAKLYGTNPDGTPLINLHWFGGIDGYLPFDKLTFEKLKEMVVEIDPDLIIGPDAFFSLDVHPDHMRTGWLTYLIVKELSETQKDAPLLLLYHSFNSDFYIPYEDDSIQVDAWAKHRSQTSPLANKIVRRLRKVFAFFRRGSSGPVKAEGFRKPTFESDENKIKKLHHKIFYAISNIGIPGISAFDPERFNPIPEELGLV